MTLRIRPNLRKHLAQPPLNSGGVIAHPGGHQSLENQSAGGALREQGVPRYEQLPEVSNAQEQYPHQAQLAQQMAGGPGQQPINDTDLATKGAINGASTPEAMSYLDRYMLGMTGTDPAVYEEALSASSRLQNRRPNV
jgi:hypothetical protein